MLLESYPIDPTPTLEIFFGRGAQIGLIYVCCFIKGQCFKTWLGSVKQAHVHLRSEFVKIMCQVDELIENVL